MPALRTSCLLLAVALAALASGCASTTPKYVRAPSLAPPEPDPQDSRNAYLELIERMQQQGAWYASLAHVEAFRQRYGDRPALRLLQADALRETGQADAAVTLYRELSSGPQAAAAAHGLGLIAARRDDDAGSEQALARATQLQPLNTDYLGDLGYARLRAGQFDQAREPLAKALELSPGNAKATANLALWAVLRGDQATAERLSAQASLNEETRRSIQQQAQQIRTRLQQRQAAAAANAATPAHTASVESGARASGGARLASEPRRDPRDQRDPQRLPPSMLERFSATDHPTGSTP
ncbi:MULTISPECIES: Flp pilus assembly protein TadD [Stenotrophomonas]|uniref:Flp pilus assembly protein TadD n=1 Tax=Stenotrophomonas TaxID=40323 RepID=UPI0007F021D2|nr:MULTISPECIES: Flp pilus assembly protein TadD [Stenotrophomonas maltophilia group]MCF3524459.1 Flp pilus assembly protein TadD [Stenotrophomonas maltophilia]MCF3553202.1 Flp pilus assembly protein TadD [Stenotrophomonas maltophilia]MCU1039562.1 Flp pilus assembly protein TadD [Stenotrophomonas maltophilia]OBU52052.1 Flp pilus assembly protein TadD [Stenotrophomonas maltophilia]OBU53636.1 Flp pilus assembly protein TadD [Stenotrophomonas maltophilia]